MPSWEQIRDQKRNEQNEAIASVQSSLEPVSVADDLPYLSAGASQIVNNIKSRTPGWTAVRVLQAYIRSASRAHQKTRCLTEVMFQQALGEAAALDEKFEVTGEIQGRLHGVPISLKDQINVQGYDSTVGFTAWANAKASEDATVVKIIRSEGGIPFVKTNIPQTLLAFSCSNPLWGESTNPYNDAATCGGSSGGEAALLGCDGSVIGIASDIGGSLRIPAHYSGCYSLKPTYPRFPVYGVKAPKPGFESIRTTYGPIARSVEDLELMTKTVCDGAEKYWSAEGILPKTYKEFSPGKGQKLKFGYYIQDNFVYTSPACERAVLETVEALRGAGHQVIELPEAPDVGQACALFSSLMSADGYSTYFEYIGSDPLEETLRFTTLGTRLSSVVRWLAAQLMYYVLGDRCLPSLLLGTRAKSVQELQRLQNNRTQLVRRWQSTVWSKEGLHLDGIIAPVQAIPAPGKNTIAKFSAMSASTNFYNIVDSTIGVIPVTTVDSQKDSLTPEWFQQFDRVTIPAFHKGTMSKLVNNGLYRGSVSASVPLYDAKKMESQPVGVQIVGPPWQEEKVLYMMKAADGALGSRGFGPGSSFKRQ